MGVWERGVSWYKLTEIGECLTYPKARMSTHTSFAVFGTGGIGSLIIDEFLRLKELGVISTVKIASRSVCFAIHYANGICDSLSHATVGCHSGVSP